MKSCQHRKFLNFLRQSELARFSRHRVSGAVKSVFDATKATYSMYSCTISGMSREMMKMDGRGSAEYQI